MTKKESTKYKFGQGELDLEKYILNLGHNVLGYIDSKGWKDGEREEFMLAYNTYLSGLKDLLTNNTNRFTTDDFGSIIDSTGQLGNDDGLDFYYNDDGEKISGEDYSNLRKRKQKKFNNFSANQEVAKYFNIIGKSLNTVPKKSKDKFNLAEHGFISHWLKSNNPIGGKLDLTPWLGKDKFDKETGKRARTNRASYLSLEIMNYLNNTNFDDYDFEGSTFGDATTYKSRLQAAAERLDDGTWTDEDLIALNQAGIGGDFLTAFFSEEENPNLNADNKLAMEEKAKEEAEARKKKELDEARTKWIDDLLNLYDKNRYLYTNRNAFSLGQLDSKYWNPETGFNSDAFRESNPVGFDSTAYLNNYLANPYNNEGKKAIAALIGMGRAKQLLSGKYAGMYYIHSDKDRANNGALIYNPVEGTLYHTFIGDVPEVWLLMTDDYNEANGIIRRSDNYQFKDGGVLGYQMGGNFDANQWLEEDRIKKLEERGKKNTSNTSRHDGRNAKQQEAGERKTFADPNQQNPNNGFSGADLVRLATIGADITSMISSFLPGAGTAVSAVAGIGSSLGTFGADVAEDGMDWGDWKNLGTNLGMDFLGLIPGGGAATKAGKIAKTAVKFVPTIMAAVGAANTLGNSDKIIASLNKLTTEPSEMTVDDWRNVSAGIGLVTGTTSAAVRMKNKAKAKAASKSKDMIAVEMVKDGQKKMVAFSGDDAKAIRLAQQSGNNDDIRKVTVRKYKDLEGYDISTDFNTRPQWVRGNGKWLAPIHLVEGNAKIYDLFNDSKGLYADKGLWSPDIRNPQLITGSKQLTSKSTASPTSDPVSSPSKTYLLMRLEIEAKNKRDLIDLAWEELWKTNPNFFRKSGGTLDLSLVRKMLKGAKTNTSSTANWFDDMYSSNQMKKWLGTFNKDNFENFNSLLRSWATNRDATNYAPGATPINYNQGVWDRQALWNNTGTNEVIENLFNNKKITRPGVTGDNANGNYQDGYFGSQEYLRHGGTKDSWSGKDTELKLFQEELAKKGLLYTLDPDSGMYLMSKIPTKLSLTLLSITLLSTEASNSLPTLTTILADSKNIETPTISKENIFGKVSSFLSNPNLLEAASLVMSNNANNLAYKTSIKELPFLLNPNETHRSIYGNLRKKVEEELAKAALTRSVANHPITSDGSLLTVALLDAQVLGQKFVDAGNAADDEMMRLTSELAWQQEKENAKNRHNVAMQNRLSLVLHYNDNLKKKAAKDFLNANNRIAALKGFIYDRKVKDAENKAREEAFAKSDIHEAVTRNLKQYYPEMTPEEETVWNKALSGVNYSELADDNERRIYLALRQKLALIELDELRKYYGIPNNLWTDVRNFTQPKLKEFSVRIVKDGAKLAIAGIEAKTRDAERFQRQIKEFIERNDKQLERLAKSMYGLPNVSVVK